MAYDFYSVRIIRSMEQVTPAVYLKEFFQFCGLYVREYIIDDQEQTDDLQRVDLNLYLIPKEKKNGYPDASLDYILKLPGNRLATKKEMGPFHTALKRAIREIDGYLERQGRLKSVFYKLIAAFEKADYAHLNYCRHCFLNQMDRDEQLKMAQKYYDCYAQLRESDPLSENCGKEYVYLKYARFNCARKVNDISKARGDLPYFKPEAIMRAAARIAELDEGFSMAYVLAGMIGLSYDTLWSDGELYMEKALQMERGSQHSVFILYALGHFREFNRSGFDEAWEQYGQILNIVSNSYRAVFKYGCRMLREQNGAEAYKLFSRVRMMIDQKKQRGVIQPFEIEYDYKCSCIILKSNTVSRYSNESSGQLHREIFNLMKTELERSRFSQEFWTNGELKNCKAYLEEKLKSHSLRTIIHV